VHGPARELPAHAAGARCDYGCEFIIGVIERALACHIGVDLRSGPNRGARPLSALRDYGCVFRVASEVCQHAEKHLLSKDTARLGLPA
jgi:hypothetical protein